MLLTGLILLGSAASEEGVHWTYSGASGPEHWGEISEAFATCSSGRSQSPIDVVDPIEAELGPIELSYRGSTTAIVNNGHTLQVDVDPGNTLDLEGQTFELAQFHFHHPSEHRIQGKSFPLEAHFVHRNEQGELAVVAVLFRNGPRSRGLETIGASAPSSSGETRALNIPIADLKIVPEGRAYYRYTGSLTTPPCTEGIRWLILKATGSVASKQVESFVKIIGEDARGPQPLNGRLVLH